MITRLLFVISVYRIHILCLLVTHVRQNLNFVKGVQNVKLKYVRCANVKNVDARNLIVLMFTLIYVILV